MEIPALHQPTRDYNRSAIRDLYDCVEIATAIPERFGVRCRLVVKKRWVSHFISSVGVMVPALHQPTRTSKRRSKPNKAIRYNMFRHIRFALPIRL